MVNLLYHPLRCILLFDTMHYNILSPPFISSNFFFHFPQLQKTSASSLRKVIRSLMESPNRSSRIYNNIKLLVYNVFIIPSFDSMQYTTILLRNTLDKQKEPVFSNFFSSPCSNMILNPKPYNS